MNNIIHVALILCIALVFLVDVLNIIKNHKLQSEINVCADLHRRLLAIIVEQEDVISAELDVLYEEIRNNKVDKLIMRISEYGGSDQVNLCPFHDQVIGTYTEWQSQIASRIKHIKRKQSAMNEKMKNILNLNEGN